MENKCPVCGRGPHPGYDPHNWVWAVNHAERWKYLKYWRRVIKKRLKI